MIIFETERLLVRPLTEADSEKYFALHGDPEIMRYIRPAKTREECDLMLVEHIELNKQLYPCGRWLVYDKHNDHFTGSFVIIPIVNTGLMQLGYSLLKEHWGKGYASELIRGGLNYTFTKTPLEEIYAVVEEGNIASEKALLRAGFERDLVLKEGNKVLKRFVMKKWV